MNTASNYIGNIVEAVFSSEPVSKGNVKALSPPESFRKEMDEYVSEFDERIRKNDIGWFQDRVSSNILVFGQKGKSNISFDRSAIENIGQSYPTKSSARIACRKAVSAAVENMRGQFFRCAEKYLAIADTGGEKLIGLFGQFIDNYPVTFAENIELECDGEDAAVLKEIGRKLAEPVEKMKAEFAEETKKAVESCRGIYDEAAEKLFSVQEWLGSFEVRNDTLGNFSFDAPNGWEMSVSTANKRSKETDMRCWDEARNAFVEITDRYCERLKKMLAEAMKSVFAEDKTQEE